MKRFLYSVCLLMISFVYVRIDAVGATSFEAESVMRQILKEKLGSKFEEGMVSQALKGLGLKADTYISEEMSKVLGAIVDNTSRLDPKILGMGWELVIGRAVQDLDVSKIVGFKGLGKFDKAAYMQIWKDITPQQNLFEFRSAPFSQEDMVKDARYMSYEKSQQLKDVVSKYESAKQIFDAADKDFRDAIRSNSKDIDISKLESARKDAFEKLGKAHDNRIAAYESVAQSLDEKFGALQKQAFSEETEETIEQAFKRQNDMKLLEDQKFFIAQEKTQQLGAFYEMELEFKKPFAELNLLEKDNIYISNAQSVQDAFERFSTYMKNNKLAQMVAGFGTVFAVMGAPLLIAAGLMEHYASTTKQSGGTEQKPPLDVSLRVLLSAPEVTSFPGQPARHLRLVNKKYYQVLPAHPQDADTIIITTFNATNQAQDSGLGYVYISAPAPSATRTISQTQGFAVRGVALELLRAYAGIKVAADGTQALGVGFEVPNISVSNLLKLQGDQTSRDVTLKNQKIEQAVRNVIAASTRALAQLPQSQKLPKSIRSAGGAYTRSNATVNGVYFDALPGRYLAQVTEGNDSYYLDLQQGYAYGPDGTLYLKPITVEGPRPRTDQVLVNSKNPKDIALLHTDVKGIKQLEYTHPRVAGSLSASAISTSSNTYKLEQDGKTTYYNSYDLFALVQDAESKGMVLFELNLKEFPVNNDGSVTAETRYTISENHDGDLKELGTYLYDPKQYGAPLYYYNTRTNGVDKGFVLDDALRSNPTILIWNGAEARTWTNIYYRNQLVAVQQGSTAIVYGAQLKKDENDIERLVTDASKKRTITIAQKNISLPANLQENVVTITTDDGNEYAFRYAPQMAQDIDAFNRTVLGVVPVVNMQGVTQLVRIIPETAMGLRITSADIKNTGAVLADVIAKSKKVFDSAVIRMTKDGMHLLYTVGQSDFKGKFVGVRLDLVNGFLYDATGTPLFAVTQDALSGVLKTLGVVVAFDDKRKPYLVYKA